MMIFKWPKKPVSSSKVRLVKHELTGVTSGAWGTQADTSLNSPTPAQTATQAACIPSSLYSSKAGKREVCLPRVSSLHPTVRCLYNFQVGARESHLRILMNSPPNSSTVHVLLLLTAVTRLHHRKYLSCLTEALHPLMNTFPFPAWNPPPPVLPMILLLSASASSTLLSSRYTWNHINLSMPGSFHLAQCLQGSMLLLMTGLLDSLLFPSIFK